MHAIPADSRNVKKHLQLRCKNKGLISSWINAYDMFQNIKKKEISDDHLKLVRFFISSNTSICQLANVYMRDLVSFNLPSVSHFTEMVLPEVLEKVHANINHKLQDAENISLISDIWTDRQMHDFMGLAASVISELFEREFIVIGMIIMPGNHCAENIQLAIESLVNKYEFDTTKIIGSKKLKSLQI